MMISYLIEFAILHLLFFGIYRTLLQEETQLGFLRFFLLGSTVLSLFIPLVSIPTSNPILPSLNTSTIMLPQVIASSSTDSRLLELEWYYFLLIGVSIVFGIKLLLGILRIKRLYSKSKRKEVNGIVVRVVSGLENSFSFFQWIFIDTTHFENANDIIHHELGHAKKYHTIDILFLNILTIFFWWIPSIWLMIKELKNIHEYEADEFALKASDKTYVKTLVHCTLQAHGMNLASSFDDAPILNRLNFIKKMKKKISTLKMASIVMLTATTGIFFACEENAEKENLIEDSKLESELPEEILNSTIDTLDAVFTEVDEHASFPGGLEAWAKYLSDNLKYPRQAKNLGIEGRVFVQFIVEKDGSFSDIKVLKGIGAGCDSAAKRIIETSPKWIPGKINGQAVRQKFIQNIAFKLQE